MIVSLNAHTGTGIKATPQVPLNDTPNVGDLAQIAWRALQIMPPRYVSAIFGSPETWLPPYRRYSEFTMLSPWRPLRLVKFLQNIGLPSIPRTPPALLPPFVEDFFWQPTLIFQRPDHYCNFTSYPEEAWFFINGIMTNDGVAQVNAALLAELFHRPITLIQNSTSSLFTDLLQCALDKEGWRVTEPVIKAFPALYDALKDPHKVRIVLIAHSQGTIIAAELLRLLKAITPAAAPAAARGALLPAAASIAAPEIIYPDDSPLDLRDFAPLQAEELAKLEMYCFATCANVMTQLTGTGIDGPIPYIEHFGNANDIVARLGMLAPAPVADGIRIDGLRFVRPGAYGHLLNEHYLYPILDAQKHGRRRGGQDTPAPFVAVESKTTSPRLYAYVNGGTPAAI